MIDGWNNRLRECRERKGYSLRELEPVAMLGLSQQSLIKYEKGEIFPRIDTLERMCRLYETNIEYVLYGNDRMAFFEQRSNSLTVLFMLLYAKRVAYDRESGSIDILEEKLKYQISLLDDYISVSDISNIEDLYRLAEGIKKIEEDR